MTTRRLATLLAAGILLEVGMFHVAYGDLIALRDVGAESSPELCASLSRTLERNAITRQHLEHAVMAAQRCGDSETELRALRRLAGEHGLEDPHAFLRLGEALRQGGHYEEAAHVFAQALNAADPSGTVR